MIQLRFDRLAEYVGGTLCNTDNAERTFHGVSIDSRAVEQEQLFVAIRGVNNNGHEFIPQAIEAGAAGLIAEYDWSGLKHISPSVPVVAVPNSHQAMITLATYYRGQLPTSFIGITGSTGKTTTKELTFQLLKAVEKSSYRSPGNLNNLFGVPLSLLAIPEDCKVAVIEMGISTSVEMPTLATMVQPDIIVITNIGSSHLEFLGSVREVAQAKLELVKASKDNVPVLLNSDDEILIEEANKLNHPYHTFGIEHTSDYVCESIETDESGCSSVVIDGSRFNLKLPGRHQVSNLLAAYASVRELGYTFDHIDTSVIELRSAPMRGEILNREGISFLVDCYNANPESMRASLIAFFARTSSCRRVLVLGDMLELGASSDEFHREIGTLLGTMQFDHAFLIGPHSEQIRLSAILAGKDESCFSHFDSVENAQIDIRSYIRSGDSVLIKGSRSIGLERILNLFSDEEIS